MQPLSVPVWFAQVDTAVTSSQLDQLGSTPYIVLTGYLLLLLILGIYGWIRSTVGEEDYYLAGRKQGWLVSSLTIMATFFSSFALLGAPGMVYREGVVFALFSLNVPVAGLCVYLLGSRIWKLGRAFGFVTPGDMIADYYGSRYSLRLLVGLTSFLYAIPYVIMQIQSGGIVSEKLFSDASLTVFGHQLSSFEIGSTVLAAITMLYIMIGGMRSVAWTDLIQGLLLISGMLVSGFAMFLVFDGAETFSRRVMSELPDSSLTSPGNSGAWPWTMVFTVVLLASTGSMVQPAQWMRYYSASGVRTLQRGAVIFAAVLTSCFILGVMLIGIAGQMLYPLRFEYRQAWEGAAAAAGPSAPGASLRVPSGAEAHLRIEQPEGQDAAPQLVWSWTGKEKPELTDALVDELDASNPQPGFRATLEKLQAQQAQRPRVAPAPEMGGDFNSVLVVILNRDIPRVLGRFGAIYASLLLVAIMAASMSTADSNLHALSAVLTRDVYDQYVRPQAGERERVWVGRGIIVGATVLSLVLVIAGSRPQIQARYDFLSMIALMGLMAIAFSAQLLPIAVDILFLRRGTSRGAAAGLAAGLLGAFLFGPLFPLLVEALGSPAALTAARELVDSLKFTPMHGSVWGLLLNVPVFVLVSCLTPPVDANRRTAYERAMR